MKPISIQLHTVRELTKDGNHVDVLRQIADIGYKAVEGHGFGLSNKEYVSLLDDLGLQLSSSWLPLPTAETLPEFLDNAHELGIKHVIGGFWIPEFESVEAISHTADRLNAVLPAIKSAGIVFSLHNHWIEFEMLEGKYRIDHLLERVPGLNLEIDIYWCTNFAANRSEEVVKKYRDITPMLHVKDGSQVRDDPMTAVGSGTLDIPATLHAANPDLLDWLVVELDACATDMMTAVSDSYRYLVGHGLALGNRPVEA